MQRELITDRYKLDKFWSRISNRLSPLMRGLSLEEWIDMIGNRLYERSSMTKPYVDLEEYFGVLNIESCVPRKDLVVPARLRNLGDTFQIEVQDSGSDRSVFHDRYHIAHEMAHIVFYDRSRRPFVDYKLFPLGSPEIESVCNRIARSIVIPQKLLRNKISQRPKPNDSAFSVEQLRQLAQEFRTPYNVVLNRLVTDTGMWDCAVFTFEFHADEKSPWKLKSRYLPPRFWNNQKAFISYGDPGKKKSDPNHYPSAKKALRAQLEAVYDRAAADQGDTREQQGFQQRFYSMTMPVEKLIARPLISFTKAFFEDTTNVRVHFSVTENNGKPIVNICIPLPA